MLFACQDPNDLAEQVYKIPKLRKNILQNNKFKKIWRKMHNKEKRKIIYSIQYACLMRTAIESGTAGSYTKFRIPSQKLRGPFHFSVLRDENQELSGVERRKHRLNSWAGDVVEALHPVVSSQLYVIKLIQFHNLF